MNPERNASTLKLFQLSVVRSPEPHAVTGVALLVHIDWRGLRSELKVAFLVACENVDMGKRAIKTAAATKDMVGIRYWDIVRAEPSKR